MNKPTKIKVLVAGKLATTFRAVSNEDVVKELPKIEKRFLKKRTPFQRTVVTDMLTDRISELRYEYDQTKTRAMVLAALSHRRLYHSPPVSGYPELVCPASNPN